METSAATAGNRKKCEERDAGRNGRHAVLTDCAGRAISIHARRFFSVRGGG
jgi:hypothetical protein